MVDSVVRVKVQRNRKAQFCNLCYSTCVYITPVFLLWIFNKFLDDWYQFLTFTFSDMWFVVMAILFLSVCYYLVTNKESSLVSHFQERLILAPSYVNELAWNGSSKTTSILNKDLRANMAKKWVIPGEDLAYEHIAKLVRFSYLEEIPRSSYQIKRNKFDENKWSKSTTLSDHGWWSYLAPMSELAQIRADESSYSIITRAWMPDAVKNIRKLNWEVHEKCEEFNRLEPIGTSRLFIKPKILSKALAGNNLKELFEGCFPYWVSWISGALILNDSSLCRSGYFSDIKVLHYDGSLPLDGENEVRLHAPQVPVGEVTRLKAGMQPGDYNGMLMDIKRVTVGNGIEVQETSLILDSTPTTYFLSEAEGYKCKKLKQFVSPVTFRSRDVDLKHGGESKYIFSAEKVQIKDDRDLLEDETADKERTNILTAYTFLVTLDNYLILTSRSGKTRHGKSVLSATAGGVVEVDNDGDLDQYGMPDVGKCVRRELKEELGLEVQLENCRPVALALMNTANARLTEDVHKIDKELFSGQMVNCAFYFGRVPHTRKDIVEQEGSNSDIYKGSFEVNELEFFSLNEASKFVEMVMRNLPRMDQHGFLSCIYTAMCVFGSSETVKEFNAYMDFPEQVDINLYQRFTLLDNFEISFILRRNSFELWSLYIDKMVQGVEIKSEVNVNKDQSWWNPRVLNIRNANEQDQTSHWEAIWREQICPVSGVYKGRATVHPSILINPYYGDIFRNIAKAEFGNW